MMQDGLIEIPATSGQIDSFLALPKARGQSCVILCMDIWGLREELFDVARFVATKGYACLVPNFYYRDGKVRHTYRDDKGRSVSIHNLPQAERERVRDSMRRLTNDMIVEDVGLILDFLAADLELAGPHGAVGYCMGGRHALIAAGRYPKFIKAAASLHGTFLVTDDAHSPHRLARHMNGEIYCAFAEKDSFADAATVAALAHAFNANPNVEYFQSMHPGAEHGYSLPDRDVYDAVATEADWRIVTSMLDRQLTRALS